MPTAGTSAPPCAGELALELDRRAVELDKRLNKGLDRRAVYMATALEELVQTEAADCVSVKAWNALDRFKSMASPVEAAKAIFEAEVISDEDAAAAESERERIRNLRRPAFAGYKPA